MTNQLKRTKSQQQQHRNILFSPDSMSSSQIDTSDGRSSTEQSEDITDLFSSYPRYTVYNVCSNFNDNTVINTNMDTISPSHIDLSSPTRSSTSLPHESSQLSKSYPPSSPPFSLPLSSTLFTSFLGSLIKFSNLVDSSRNTVHIAPSNRGMSKVRACSLMYTLLVVLTLLAMHVPSTQASSLGMCRGILCANGGTLLASNSIYAHCRCQCRQGFVGPYCQYETVSKRSTENTPVGRSERLQGIREQLIRLAMERRRRRSRTRRVHISSNTAGLPSPDTVGIRPTAAYRITGIIRPRRSFKLTSRWPRLFSRLS